jgi:hypothetical protein
MRRRTVTAQSEFNHSYARRPVAAKDPFFVFWADGNPDQPSPSRLYFTDSKGAALWRMPYTFPPGSDSASPERVR